MAKDNIRDFVRETLEEYLPSQGLNLYYVEYKKEGPEWYLRVYLDKAGTGEEYVSIDECEEVSRYLGDRLDEEDPIERNYILEVSSPGLDRQLFREEDYERFSGREVEVRLFKALDGKKDFYGKLLGTEDGNVKIKTAEGELSFPLENVAKANLAVII